MMLWYKRGLSRIKQSPSRGGGNTPSEEAFCGYAAGGYTPQRKEPLFGIFYPQDLPPISRGKGASSQYKSRLTQTR
jgi:hypothetical protein